MKKGNAWVVVFEHYVSGVLETKSIYVLAVDYFQAVSLADRAFIQLEGPHPHTVVEVRDQKYTLYY